jgi:RNA polymerase sigma-70 factor (ECF subfamily)
MIAVSENLLTDLLRRAGCGDETALRDLQQLTRNLLAYCIRRIVKDPWREEEVLQDVYTYIWQHAAEYRKERGTPLAWFCTLARSRAIDCFRRTRREPVAVEFDDGVRPVVQADASREPVEVWQHSLVRTGVQELPPDQRRLIGMAFFDGYSHSEIAERTGMPLGTVKTKIRSALTVLREKLPRAA